MADVIVLGIVAVIILAAGGYVYQAKKKGVKCIGCPSAGTCAARNNAQRSCGCGCQSDTE